MSPRVYSSRINRNPSPINTSKINRNSNFVHVSSNPNRTYNSRMITDPSNYSIRNSKNNPYIHHNRNISDMGLLRERLTSEFKNSVKRAIDKRPRGREVIISNQRMQSSAIRNTNSVTYFRNNGRVNISNSYIPTDSRYPVMSKQYSYSNIPY